MSELTSSALAKPFQGFEPITGNFVYCPNQFFDICLPNCSRGAVRIVAYMLRQTLGWLDKQGNPMHRSISVTYRELIEGAGVSRGAIKKAMMEVRDYGFVDFKTVGVSCSAGNAGQAAKLVLRWDTQQPYTREIKNFDGFYAGEGHRTPVPNRFFDHVVRSESLAVFRVVGTVIRHTVGYQTQFGGRRTSAQLSYCYISQYANLSNGKTLSKAIQAATDSGYIVRVKQGHFSDDKKTRSAAEYSIRWQRSANQRAGGPKSPADQQRSNKPSSTGSKHPAEKWSKKPCTKKNNSNENYKQQDAGDLVIESLISEGFDRATAENLIEKRGVDVLQRQVKWLDARQPRESRIGMLRKAIDEDWPIPASFAQQERRSRQLQREQESEALRISDDAKLAAHKSARARRKRRLVEAWKSASQEERTQWIRDAVKREASKSIAELIRRQDPSVPMPHVQVLEVIAKVRELPSVIDTTKVT